MKIIFPAKPSTIRNLQKGQNFVELAFILAALALAILILFRLSGASNSELVARVDCTVQAHQWVDMSTPSNSLPSPIYGCLKISVGDAAAHSRGYLADRASYLPGFVFNSQTHRRVG